MNCPNCDRYTPDDSPVCIHCGAQLPEVETSSSPARYPKNTGTARIGTRSTGRGVFSGWTIVIAGVVVLAGILLFFLLRSTPPHGYVTEFPDGPVDLSTMIVSGKTNIVDMYSEYCPPCRLIAPYLDKLAKVRSDIHIIRIDINRKGHRGIDWGSPIAAQFQLRSIPHFIIIDGKGKILEEGKAAYKKIVKMIQNAGIR